MHRATAYHCPSTFQPEHHFPPRQRRFHPSYKARAPGLARCGTVVPWQAIHPLFQSPLGEPFGPSVCGVAARAWLGLRLSTLQCLIGVACLAPSTPSADSSAAVNASCPTFSARLAASAPPGASRGKTRCLPCIDAGFTECTPTTDGGLRSHVPARPGA